MAHTRGGDAVDRADASGMPGLSDERAHQLSVDNQTGRAPTGDRRLASSDPTSVPPAGDVLDSNLLNGKNDKQIDLPGVGFDQTVPNGNEAILGKAKPIITDCSKDICIVNQKEYDNNTDIPGNRPVELRRPDGSVVLGHDGKPITAPERANLDKIVDELKAMQKTFGTHAASAYAMYNFRHGGDWDFQRMMSDNNRTIYTHQYKDFANVAIGYVLGALGGSVDDIARTANAYCADGRCRFNEPMSPRFPNIPTRMVEQFRIGAELYEQRRQAN